MQLASLFSIYGCCRCCHEAGGARVDQVALDAERGTYVALSLEENWNMPSISKSLNSGLNSHEEYPARKTAGILGYTFQIIYQVSILRRHCFAFPQCAEFGKDTKTFKDYVWNGMESSGISFFVFCFCFLSDCSIIGEKSVWKALFWNTVSTAA